MNGSKAPASPKVIRSRSHSVVKEARRLRSRTYRDRDGVFLVEGPSILQEAAASGATLRKILYTADRLEMAEGVRGAGSGAALFEVDESLMGWISDVTTCQGIAGVVEQVDTSPPELLDDDCSILVIAGQVRDPGNMGALMRVADAAGVDGFLATEGSVDIYNPKVVRSGAGSHFHLPIARGPDPGEVALMCRRAGMRLLGLDPRGKSDYLETCPESPAALIVGNEVSGIPEQAIPMLDDTVYIGMPGRAESLNVACSAAVVLFEWIRRRSSGDGGR